jgi:hypothetical protein
MSNKIEKQLFLQMGRQEKNLFAAPFLYQHVGSLR